MNHNSGNVYFEIKKNNNKTLLYNEELNFENCNLFAF